MVTYAEYFDANRIKSKYLIGQRVQGFYNKIPFRGTVLVEHTVSEEEGIKVHVWLDLPIKVNEKYLNMITCSPKDLKPLK